MDHEGASSNIEFATTGADMEVTADIVGSSQTQVDITTNTGEVSFTGSISGVGGVISIATPEGNIVVVGDINVTSTGAIVIGNDGVNIAGARFFGECGSSLTIGGVEALFDNEEANCDLCPDNPDKRLPGECGCDSLDVDSDSDGVLDCEDNCPDDPDKLEPGLCDCGYVDEDMDNDGTFDCDDGCPANPEKTTHTFFGGCK